MESPENLFLYYLKLTPAYNDPSKWDTNTVEVIEAHAAFLSNLGEKGILAFAGRTNFDPGHKDLLGIAVVMADSIEEAHQIMDPDPAVVQGIQSARIFPFSMGIRFLSNLE